MKGSKFDGWTKTNIGSVCRVGDGAHGSLKRYNQGILYLTSKNFKDDGLDLTKIDYIDEATYQKYFKEKSGALSKPKEGDVLFSIIGSIGTPYVVKSSDYFGMSSSVAMLRPNESIVLSKYLFYWIKGYIFQDALYGIKGGVAQGYVSLEMIRSLPISYPPLPTQLRIANILSAYDDLIENNTRRIRVLEQMAQATYQLWFGKVNKQALPKNWKYQTLQEVADVIDCLHTKKPTHTDNGIGILLQLNNIGENGKLDLSKIFLLGEEDYKIWTSRMEVREGDCVITNVGRVAAVAQIPVGVKAALGRNMTGVRPQLITPTFLIEFLLSPQMDNEVHNKKDSGVIMDALNVRGIVKLELPVPPLDVLKEFEKVVRPIRRRIELMVNQNANLRQTRDLLLPRLVSGEVEVSPLPEPAA
jgi:type I restriction enzyme S subunit